MDFLLRVDTQEALRFCLSLVVGGCIAHYLKYLYMKFGNSVSNTDLISRIFPLLTIITICIIAVVKSSLALSLGLVGALSIVRFRAAIKDPEELVYLFLCIGVGLAIGAGQMVFAIGLVLVVSIFVMGQSMPFFKKNNSQSLLLTITGDADKYFKDDNKGVITAVKNSGAITSIQRYDIDQDQGMMRVIIGKSSVDETLSFISDLKKQFPECSISYINMNTII